MPKRGQYSDISALPGPRRELTERVRELCRLIGGGPTGLRPLSNECNISRSTLSDLVNGRVKRPNPAILRMLYSKAAEQAGAEPMPLTLEQLEELSTSAKDDRPLQLCARCRALTAQPAAQFDRPQPAGPLMRQPVVEAALPVPTVEGDRQVARADNREWLGIGDLSARLRAGEHGDAVGILHYVGLVAGPSETAAAIATCFAHGLDEAAGTIIAYAAQRGGREVMQIASALLKGAQPRSAEELLELTLAA